MSRIPRAEVQWRVMRGGRVRHAVQPDGLRLLRGVCGEAGTWLLADWFEDPSKPECRTCSRRVEPAPTEENPMPDAPLPVNTRVYHCNQRKEAARRGTATITAVKGPYNDSSYEYEVLTGVDFSRSPGPSNPETRTTWWSSLATIPAKETTDA